MILNVFTEPAAARETFRKAQAEASRVVDLTNDESVRWSAVRIPQGTTSGASSVIFQITLPDGVVVMVQTTLALLESAVAAFRGADSYDADERARRRGRN